MSNKPQFLGGGRRAFDSVGADSVVGLVIRHALTFVGGLLAAKGYVDAEQVPVIAGCGVTVVGVVMSYFQKKKQVSS
jgi:hypothetical protein